MPARPSRRSKESNQTDPQSARDVATDGKAKGGPWLGSPKSKNQIPAAKQRAGSARGR